MGSQRMLAKKKPLSGAKTTFGVQKTISKEKDNKDTKGGKKEWEVAADFEVDTDKVFTGKIGYFEKRKGFGRIDLDDKGIVPNDNLFVHWKNIISEDRWPYLNRDMEVEFKIEKTTRINGTGAFLGAVEVCLPGGEPIALQEEYENKREYVGGKNLRYTGNVVWFDWKKGFGFVKIEDGYDIPDEVPEELRIHRDEVSSGKDTPHLRDGMEVEFGISKNANGKYAVYNLTLPGGDPVTRAAFDNRVDCGDDMFIGQIKVFSGGYGYVEAEDNSKFSDEVQKKLKEMTEKRSKKGGESKDELLYVRKEDVNYDGRIERGMKIQFKVHLSDKGVGAHDADIMME